MSKEVREDHAEEGSLRNSHWEHAKTQLWCEELQEGAHRGMSGGMLEG